MIAGKRVVAFRREDEGEVPSGEVLRVRAKLRRKAAPAAVGVDEVATDARKPAGGVHVGWRRECPPVQEYLHPFSEHLIDWFHIAMRRTVLQQQTKALQEERPQIGAEVSKQLESVKHLLWHGNTEEALERIVNQLMDLSLISAHSDAAEKVADGLAEFETYIRNNQEFIPNFGERRRQGETISTGFVESTINQVGSRRVRQEATDAVDAAGRPIFCYRRGPRSSTTSSRRRSADGTRSSELKPRDPRLFDALQIGKMVEVLPVKFAQAAAVWLPAS